MFVICDKNNIVQDIATEMANLSRGYDFDGYKLCDIEIDDIRIGDSYINGIHTKNIQIRTDVLARQINEMKITNKIRAIAINALKNAGDLPADFEG